MRLQVPSYPIRQQIGGVPNPVVNDKAIEVGSGIFIKVYNERSSKLGAR